MLLTMLTFLSVHGSVSAFALSALDNRLRFLCLPTTPLPACLSLIPPVNNNNNARARRKPKCLPNLSQQHRFKNQFNWVPKKYSKWDPHNSGPRLPVSAILSLRSPLVRTYSNDLVESPEKSASSGAADDRFAKKKEKKKRKQKVELIFV